MEVTQKLAIGSIAVGITVLVLKYLAYALTGSIALYSDAVESIVNVAAAVAALIAIRLSNKPADRNHPYGHGKAEYFSAVLEGVLIVLAALAILYEAFHGFVTPKALVLEPFGLLVNAFAGALNGAWCWVLLRQGRLHRSPTLIADGKHLLSDVISSTGVLVGVVLAMITGWSVLDPLLAGAVAINILVSGWRLVMNSVGGLMDEGVPRKDLLRIESLISRHAVGALQAHDLRTRRSGPITFVEFHLVVPGRLTVHDAHEVCDRIERSIREAFKDAIITIHVEPEDKAKAAAILVPGQHS